MALSRAKDINLSQSRRMEEGMAFFGTLHKDSNPPLPPESFWGKKISAAFPPLSQKSVADFGETPTALLDV